MKKAIKYRGKDLRTGKWLYGDLIENQGRFFIYHATSETTIQDNDNGSITIVANEIDADTVGRISSFVDRQKKEIYEGDIIRLNLNENRVLEMIVSFTKGQFVMIDPETPYSEKLLCYYLRYATVIGNIYENRELPV